MLKNNVGSLVLVFAVASCVCSCSSSETQIERDAAVTGGTTTTGGASATGGKTGGGLPSTGGTTAAGGASATGGTSATAGGASATGGSSATGGASAAGGSATTGGATSSGGDTAAGGGTGTSTMTLAQACAKNCALASGLDTCSTTTDVCVQSCMTTFDNTSAVNPDLGRQYTVMMVCVANDPFFATSAGFKCAKPNSPLNLWSPVVDLSADTPCNEEACEWNCNDATHGNMDPWVDIQCSCSSVH
jgi:hypothetical protein